MSLGELGKLLGPLVRAVTSSNKQQLTSMETLVKETQQQIMLNKGGDYVSKITMKENGKVKKDPMGKPMMVPIKSWFNNEGQFKPTPSNVTFFGTKENPDENSLYIGDNDKGKVLDLFLNDVQNGDYQEHFSHWEAKVEKRKSNFKHTQKILNDR